MLYLVSAIIFGSLFSIVFKVCQEKGIDTSQVILFNYVTAFLASAFPLAVRLLSGTLEPSALSLHFSSVCLAFLQGVLFMAGFVVMSRSVWRSGVALTTVSARSSLVLSMIFSWAFLAQPAPRWIPVLIILVALALIVLPAESQKHDPALLTNKTDAQRRRRTLLVLVIVFVCYGISDFCLKLAQHSVAVHVDGAESSDTHLDSLMGFIFLFASIVSLIWCFIRGSFRRKPVGIRSITGGVILGVVNILCTSSSLRALSSMSTSLYYPLYNIGIVIVSTLCGMLFFKERIKWIQLLGIAVSLLAITLFFR